MGDANDVSSLLVIHKPDIIVDGDGGELLLRLSFLDHASRFSVARIVCGEDALLSQTATVSLPQNEFRDENGTPSLSLTFLTTTVGSADYFYLPSILVTMPMVIVLVDPPNTSIARRYGLLGASLQTLDQPRFLPDRSHLFN